MLIKSTSRYSEQELETFQAIMKLKHGFKDIIDICAANTDVFFTFVKLVSYYMHII